jgi:hypothetical protein
LFLSLSEIREAFGRRLKPVNAGKILRDIENGFSRCPGGGKIGPPQADQNWWDKKFTAEVAESAANNKG